MCPFCVKAASALNNRTNCIEAVGLRVPGGKAGKSDHVVTLIASNWDKLLNKPDEFANDTCMDLDMGIRRP